MGIKRYQLHNGQLPLWSIFWAGVLTGIIIINFGKSILLENTGLLDEYTLYHMKYMTVDSSALFYYILRIRIKCFLSLVIFATTYLGLLVCAGTAFGYGVSLGAYLSVLLIRYGIKGILFAVLSIFPQYLLYVPAMAGLLLWCEGLNRSIYFKSGFLIETEGNTTISRRIIKLAGLLLLVLVGCIAESFVNPNVMKWLLDFF